jgi:UPF0176 protein
MSVASSIKTDHSRYRSSFTVAAFYKFIFLEDLATLQNKLTDLCSKQNIYGTILLAEEGINGTVSGKGKSINALFFWLQSQSQFCNLQIKYSYSENLPFHRLKIRLKKEIVTMGEPNIDPNQTVGQYVKPENWNDFINDPDTLIIDTRNQYEVTIGTFKNAINPQTNSFREFPKWVKNELDSLPDNARPKRIAMFCTGGIRCEKATSYLAQKGYRNIFHLEGGILKYLETVPLSESKWMGDCFVFDQRVSVAHGLVPGKYKICHACRMPITDEEIQSAEYEMGVSCPKCYGGHTLQQQRRFRDRQKQVDLAKQRGSTHIGSVFGKPS